MCSTRPFYFEKVHCDMNTPFLTMLVKKGCIFAENPLLSKSLGSLTCLKQIDTRILIYQNVPFFNRSCIAT